MTTYITRRKPDVDCYQLHGGYQFLRYPHAHEHHYSVGNYDRYVIRQDSTLFTSVEH